MIFIKPVTFLYRNHFPSAFSKKCLTIYIYRRKNIDRLCNNLYNYEYFFNKISEGFSMATQVITLNCPTCGGTVNVSQQCCEYCGNPVLISTFQSVIDMPAPTISKHVSSYRQALAADPENKALNTSVAMCFLKLKLYDQALSAFEKAMEFNFDNSEVFFYAAVCLLEGKIPFLHLRPTIDKILSYIESALMIEPRGIYYYFLAYIKHDYFKRKFLNVTPNYSQHLQQALSAGVTESDIAQLYSILGTTRPAGL